MRRIAVWNTAFLGDAVLTLPLLQSLRLRYPQARLDFYVRGGLADLFAPHPALNAVYTYDKKGGEKGLAGVLGLAQEVASRKYDLWISAHGSLRSGLAARASRAPMRIGYDKPAFSRFFYTHRVRRRFSELDEIERLLQLLTPLGPGPLSAWPELALGNRERAEAGRFFAGLSGPVLGLHPGSVWGTKRWEAANFGEIGRRALAEGASVLVFAGQGEQEAADSVYGEMLAGQDEEAAKRAHNLAGRLSLPLLAAYLARLSCYVTNDSGPMHVAWSQRTPVTAIFGPTVRSLGFFPRGRNATVFEADVACRPCGLHGPVSCPLGHHECMRRVMPEAVWRDARAKLWPGGEAKP